jgi:hypothetical protein
MSRRPKDCADIFVSTWIIPTIATALETYPELDVAEVLQLCAPALSQELRREFRDVRQHLIDEIRTRLR